MKLLKRNAVAQLTTKKCSPDPTHGNIWGTVVPTLQGAFLMEAVSSASYSMRISLTFSQEPLPIPTLALSSTALFICLHLQPPPQPADCSTGGQGLFHTLRCPRHRVWHFAERQICDGILSPPLISPSNFGWVPWVTLSQGVLICQTEVITYYLQLVSGWVGWW